MKKFFIIIIVMVFTYSLYAMAAKESTTSSDRAIYLSGQGYITPADEIEIDAYIAQEDYDYPLPVDSPVNFVVDAEQIGELAYLQVGMKAQKTAFKDLPKFNLAFVIDCSGSMSEANKLEWVKDSFEIFIENVRPTDYVSLIVFSNDASVCYPATQMKTYVEKQNFKNKVLSMRASGGTNIYDGLAAGYQEVIANYDSSYNNRVILLTDGEHNARKKTKDDIVNLAAKYNKLNINVSCIGLGTSADVNLMNDIAIEGGGSSRFISNHEKMVETFSTELDRLLVPAARNLNITLTLGDDIKLLETWGYKNKIAGQAVSYELESIHNGDYETIVAELLLSKNYDSSRPIAWLSYNYKTMDNKDKKNTAIPIYLMEKTPDASQTIKNGRILKSEAYIRLARLLIDIANRAENITTLQKQYNSIVRNDASYDTVYINGDPVQSGTNKDNSSKEIMDEILYQLNLCIQNIDAMRTDLMRIDDILPGDQFVKDFKILDNNKAMFERTLNNMKSLSAKTDGQDL